MIEPIFTWNILKMSLNHMSLVDFMADFLSNMIAETLHSCFSGFYKTSRRKGA